MKVTANTDSNLQIDDNSLVRTRAHSPSSRKLTYQPMIAPYAGLNRTDIFKLCTEISIKTDDHQALALFQNQDNPYSLTDKTPHQAFARTVLNDFVLVNLLKSWMSQPTLSLAKNPEKNFEYACSEVAAFLKDNGPNALLLMERLEQLKISSVFKNEILPELQPITPASSMTSVFKLTSISRSKSTESIAGASTTIQLLEKLHKTEIQENGINLNFLIKSINKIPYQLSGLRHTLFRKDSSSNQWYETYYHYNMNNSHDAQNIGALHQYFVQKEMAKTDPDTQNSSLLIGKGAFSKVKLVFDIKNRTPMAEKKFNELKYFNLDLLKFEHLNAVAKSDKKGSFNFPEEAFSLPAKKALLDVQNSKVNLKGKMILPLIQEESNYIRLDHFHEELGVDHNLLKYEQHIAEILEQVIQHTMTLESKNLVNTDFKPDNIFNVIGDCLDMIYLKEFSHLLKKNEKFIFTPTFCMPHVYTEINPDQKTLETYNRYALGIMLIEMIFEKIPVSKTISNIMKLPPQKSLNSRFNIKDSELGFSARGYLTDEIKKIPDTIHTRAEPLTLFEKGIIAYAKLLVADDRKIAARVSLKDMARNLNKLRLDQSENPKHPKEEIYTSMIEKLNAIVDHKSSIKGIFVTQS